MKNLNNVSNFKQFKLNESLNYCDSCHMLSPTPKCNLCQILNILGITKEEDSENIYGKLKYYKNFKDADYINDFLDTLKISPEQKEKIMKLL